ncbi:hypothetical protein HLB42_07745 [Deinococcus sp. D7000]|nr:hypothetical protein HLB42_07745 [Deinococcus sp. D7000]
MSLVRSSIAMGDTSGMQLPLKACTTNRYAKLVSLEYSSVVREVLSHV